MAGIISKAIRGAAGAGAQMSMDQFKANITAQRDAKLQQYQAENRSADQGYRTGERVAGQEFTAGENEKNRENQLSLQDKRNQQGGAVQGDIQLMEYMVKHGVAKDQNEAFKLMKTMKSDPSKGVMDLAKMLQKSDETNFTTRPAEEYLSEAKSLFQQYLSSGSSTSDDQPGGPKPGAGQPAPKPAPDGPAQIRSDEEFNQLQSGTRFIGPDGKVRIKP